MRDVIRGGAIVYGLLAAGFSALAALLLAGAGSRQRRKRQSCGDDLDRDRVVGGVGVWPGTAVGVCGLAVSARASQPAFALAADLAVVLGIRRRSRIGNACSARSGCLRQSCCRRYTSSPPRCPSLILAAAVLPSLQVGGAGLTRRNFIAMFAYGALFATAVAITLESIAALAAMGMAVGLVAVLPGGQETLQKVSLILQSQAVMPDP